MGAFRRAVAMGYRYLETDVHATSDGELVAFHDTHLDRVTDSDGAIVDLPYAAVREARINGTDAVPLLTELLEELPTVRLNIDIKADSALAPDGRHDPARTAPSSGCASRRSASGGCGLRDVPSGPGWRRPRARSGRVLLRYAPGLLSRWLHTPAPVLQIPVAHRMRGREITLVTPQLVSVAHRLGKQVHVWFHPWSDESAAEMHRLLDLGVDGIVTDHIADPARRPRRAWPPAHSGCLSRARIT